MYVANCCINSKLYYIMFSISSGLIFERELNSIMYLPCSRIYVISILILEYNQFTGVNPTQFLNDTIRVSSSSCKSEIYSVILFWFVK